jgi:uncharacterized membrane protein
MKNIWAYVICIIIIVSGYLYSNTLKQEKLDSYSETMARGEVLEMKEISDSNQNLNQILSSQIWEVEVRVKSGPFANSIVSTIHVYGDNVAYDFIFEPGDEVILSLEVDENTLSNAYISDLSRDKYLKYLCVIFFALIIFIGGRQGISTILSLLITGLAVVSILLPAILIGKDPIMLTIIVCTGIIIITHMLITGFTSKSLAAISGTLIGIVVSGLIAKYVISLSHINGLGSEESRMLFFSYGDGKLDITGILFAGIVLGSLGAVMDVAMSIASSIQEIHQANPALSGFQLAKKGLNVGRDIIGTMANTLILANAGMALPLMLLILANDIPYLKIINMGLIATEIIRALSGSIGLFLAVPFTAFVSAFLYTRKGNNTGNRSPLKNSSNASRIYEKSKENIESDVVS